MISVLHKKASFVVLSPAPEMIPGAGILNIILKRSLSVQTFQKVGCGGRTGVLFLFEKRKDGLHLLILCFGLERPHKNQSAAPAPVRCFRRRRRSPPQQKTFHWQAAYAACKRLVGEREASGRVCALPRASAAPQNEKQNVAYFASEKSNKNKGIAFYSFHKESVTRLTNAGESVNFKCCVQTKSLEGVFKREATSPSTALIVHWFINRAQISPLYERVRTHLCRRRAQPPRTGVRKPVRPILCI